MELSLSSEDIVRTKHCLTNDPSIFSQDQKYQIQKASENIVKHILTEMLKDMSLVSLHHPESKIDKENPTFVSEKSQESVDSQEAVEQNITKSNDVFIDKIAGLIIKYVCEQHLQPFLEKRQSSTSVSKWFADKQQFTYASTYSSTFLEDVVSGVVSKIFHRVAGTVQVESTRNSEDVLCDKAETLIYWITEEFSNAQVTTIVNAEERLRFSPVRSDVLKNVIDTVYSKVLEEYEVEIMPDKDFLNDTKALAGRITKIILTEIFDFQIPPDLVANLPLSLHSKLSQNALINNESIMILVSQDSEDKHQQYILLCSHIFI